MLEKLATWLPAWAIPAAVVIYIFWNGDKATPPTIRRWLSETISGAKLTVPDISGIEALGQVFALVYGEKLFGWTTLLSVRPKTC
jgi:hypothetical protein